MPKIFPIVVKKITNIIAGGAANVLAKIRSGISVRVVTRLLMGTVRAGTSIRTGTKIIPGAVRAGTYVRAVFKGFKVSVRSGTVVSTTMSGIIGFVRGGLKVGMAPSKSTIVQKLGTLIATFVHANPAKALIKAGTSVKNKSSCVLARPLFRPGTSVVKVWDNLISLLGAKTCTEYAVGGRTDYSNPTNAVGKHDGTSASIAGNLLGARSGGLEMAYEPLTGKGSMDILTVKLKWYWAISGLGPLDSHSFYYDIGSGKTLWKSVTSGSYLANPDILDLTGIVTSWTQINSIKTYVESSMQALSTATMSIDAVEREVTAKVEQYA
jgi:hypothetical protein